MNYRNKVIDNKYFDIFNRGYVFLVVIGFLENNFIIIFKFCVFILIIILIFICCY